MRVRGQAEVATPPRPYSLSLRLASLGLIFAGLTALYLGAVGRFLPHDESFLGMSANDLCALHGCRVVHFMVHDRVSFGGAVVAIGLVYLWLTEFPLRQGQAWAWWALLLSGAAGFASFFAYLGYGYLDTWHAIATLGLLSCFLLGLVESARLLTGPWGFRSLLRPSVRWPWFSAAGLGRGFLLAASAGMVFAGLTILVVGMTCVFVPQDLAYLGLGVDELRALNPRLVPLIAHDRAGFGGAVCSCGVAIFCCVWCGAPSRVLWCVLALAGATGFGAAIGVHPAVGYNDAAHLAPAGLGAFAYVVGITLTFRPMVGRRGSVACGGEPLAPKPAEAVSAMTADGVPAPTLGLPSLRELGPDLLVVTARRRALSLALPFLWCGAYFALAAAGCWPAAVLALVALSFVTYGSTSHDLVHRNLGLPRLANDVLLCLIELLALRSGHAYQAAHLHHHARYPRTDDVEARAARRSWLGALAEGVVFQPRIWLWAVRSPAGRRAWVVGEGVACLALAGLAMGLAVLTPILLVYVVLMVVGAWVIPLVTSYLPHDPGGEGELSQTRAFRGVALAVLALGHLYHLEHHLYPAVPHHNWSELARRLDPYLRKAGVRPVRLWF